MGEEEIKSLLPMNLGLFGKGECANKQEAKASTKDYWLCFFYDILSVGYRFLIINSSTPEMAVDTIMESRDAIFFENEFPMKNAPSTTSHEFIIFHEHENFIPIEQTEEPYMQILRRMTL